MPNLKFLSTSMRIIGKSGLPTSQADIMLTPYSPSSIAEAVTLQREAILRGVVELRFDVMGNPEATGDLGRAEALVRDGSEKGD